MVEPLWAPIVRICPDLAEPMRNLQNNKKEWAFLQENPNHAPPQTTPIGSIQGIHEDIVEEEDSEECSSEEDSDYE